MRALMPVVLAACAVDQAEPELEIVAKQSGNSLSENAIAMYAGELNQLVNAPLAQSAPLVAIANGLFGRRLLNYVGHCALPLGVTVAYVDASGTPRRIPDSPVLPNGVPTGIGLAAAWPTRALTPGEARWVMGCTLAHINAKGRVVDISVRGYHAALATTAAERTAYPFLEGAFYGEFLDPRDPDVATRTRQYACWGPGLATCANPAAELWGRICTRGGCQHFTVVGPCERSLAMPATTPVACDARSGDAYRTCYASPVVAPAPGVDPYTAGVVTTYLREVACD